MHPVTHNFVHFFICFYIISIVVIVNYEVNGGRGCPSTSGFKNCILRGNRGRPSERSRPEYSSGDKKAFFKAQSCMRLCRSPNSNYLLTKVVWCGPHRILFCRQYHECCCREISTGDLAHTLRLLQRSKYSQKKETRPGNE